MQSTLGPALGLGGGAAAVLRPAGAQGSHTSGGVTRVQVPGLGLTAGMLYLDTITLATCPWEATLAAGRGFSLLSAPSPASASHPRARLSALPASLKLTDSQGPSAGLLEALSDTPYSCELGHLH